MTIYASIGPAYAGLGALAGILGATALGLVAPVSYTHLDVYKRQILKSAGIESGALTEATINAAKS